MAGAVTLSLGLPDVYVQRRRRLEAPPRMRTDVAGLVGFEPRVRPLEATLQPAVPRHRVSVQIAAVEVRIEDTRARLVRPPGGELVLSQGAAAPVAAGEQIPYAIVAVLPLVVRASTGRDLPECRPQVVAGTPVAGVSAAPDDSAVDAALGAAHGPWTRLADVLLRREADTLWLTVHPRTPPVVCEDWGDYVLQLGTPPDDGTRLASTVRAFFVNGGDRCHVATVRRPFPEDDAELAVARADMVGVPDAGVARATGVARLVLIDEVALIAAPDLHAVRPAGEALEVPVPPSDADADFRACGPPEPPPAPAQGQVTFGEPIYPSLDEQFATELDMLDLLARHGLGVQLIVTPPLHPDPATGRFGPPDAEAAKAWRLRPVGADAPLSFAACYWPWLQTQEAVGAEPRDEPPLGAALGIIARRDLARGPFVAPANEPALGVVGPTHLLTDADHRELYDAADTAATPTGRAINVFRPFPTRGIELWGSRTLASDPCLRHLPVRRGLSAIERQAAASLAEVVFEPSSPLLAIRVTQMMATLLLRLFDAGALRGAAPEQAFTVRCDDEVNPPEAVAEGRFVCDVSVALAAPAEFIVFRLAMRDQAIQVVER
jgi:hypothetical protein